MSISHVNFLPKKFTDKRKNIILAKSKPTPCHPKVV